MSEIQQVKISHILSNPMRRTKVYPFNEDKIASLRQSIRDVGLWEGLIGRRQGVQVELAFGHHRKEAARQELGDNAKIPVIIRDLDDGQMVQFMGRENLEEYNADFLIMLESWEAAAEFFARTRAKTRKLLDIATFLGWVRLHPDGDLRANHTARACDDASKLIAGHHLTRSDLKGLSVKAVMEICGRIVAQHERLEKMAAETNRPREEVKAAKEYVSKGGKAVARAVREERVAHRDIRGQVDLETHLAARREPERRSPLFHMFADRLADDIAKIFKSDSYAEKFHAIQDSLGDLTLDDDIHLVERVGLECGHLKDRAAKWETVFRHPQRKVTALKQIREA